MTALVHIVCSAFAGGVAGSAVTLLVVGVKAGAFTHCPEGPDTRSAAVANVLAAANRILDMDYLDPAAAVRHLESAQAVAAVFCFGRLAPLYHLGDALVGYAKDLPVASGVARADLLAQLARSRDDYLAGARRALAGK